jgi:hypothetical protein
VKRTTRLTLLVALVATGLTPVAPVALAQQPLNGRTELPAGHPPMDAEPGAAPAPTPPAGHPPTSAEPGAASPHGPSRSGVELFEAPADTAEEDASLPAGTIAIRIVDARNRPLVDAPVRLGVLANTVARGESQASRTGVTDAMGTLRFDGLETGSGVTYAVRTTRGPATYTVPPFALSDKAGRAVVLHAYEASKELGQVLVGMQGGVYISLKEDSLSIETGFNVFNVGAVAWVADNVIVPLPAGFKAFNTQETMAGVRVEEARGKGAAIVGTVGPGRHDLGFRYQVPFEGKSQQTLRVPLPPHVAQARVIVEASKAMGLSVGGFPTAEPTKTQEGKRILVTERQASRAEGGIRELEITLTGLPTVGPGRWIALGLAVAAIAGALVVVRRRDDDAGMAKQMRKELVEARESLLDEVVALEHAHKSGEIGPKTHARVRASLLDALARIGVMLEARAQATAPKTPKKTEAPS